MSVRAWPSDGRIGSRCGDVWPLRSRGSSLEWPGADAGFVWRVVSRAGDDGVSGRGVARMAASAGWRWRRILVRSQIRMRSTPDRPASRSRSCSLGWVWETRRADAELTACSALVAAKSSERFWSRTTRPARARSRMTRARSPSSASSRAVGSRSTPGPRSTATSSATRSGSIPRVGARAALEDTEMPCYRRAGDVSRRLLTTKYRSTKKANPIIGKPIYITFLHVLADWR
jgi:hypothetical protein